MTRTLYIVLLILICSMGMSQPKSVVFKTLVDISPITYDDSNNVDWVYTSLLTTYNILNINDLLLTRRALDGGDVKEGNILMYEFVKNRPWDMVVKISGMCVTNYVLKSLKERNEPWAYIMISAAIILYAYVNYANYMVVMKL